VANRKPRLALIYAGGTIGSEYDAITGALKPLDFTRLKKFLPELAHLNAIVETFSTSHPKDSAEATPEDWNELAGLIAQHHDAFDGFVILHGTDTMAYAASALSFMLEGLARPIVFTGSQLPLNVRRSDGRENILNALELAALRKASGKPLFTEVTILFRHQLHRANRATKISTDHFEAFESPNFPPLADIGVHFRFREHLLLPFAERPFRIRKINADLPLAYLTFFPGLKAQLIRNTLLTPGLRAIVLETFGTGNIPNDPETLDVLREAFEKHIVLISISSCKRGSVRQDTYAAGRRLASLGALSAYDMTREACVAKLYYVLSVASNPEKIKALWMHNLRGEITLESSEGCPKDF